MLGIDFKQLLLENNHDFKKCVEHCGNKFLDGVALLKDSNVKTLVVRASKYGTMIIDFSRTAHWIPAYWSWWVKEDGEHVVDVTGAGNAFCGGYAYGWVKTHGDALESAYYGAISASFVVEKMGVPQFSVLSNGVEAWNNGPSPIERLNILKSDRKQCKFI